MPQLTGPEEKELVELLQHALLSDAGALDRALRHAGLGDLSDYAANDTFPAMAAQLVAAMAARYKIIPLVEAVLNGDFLQGSCPPVEAWLNAKREELLRRAAAAAPTGSGLTIDAAGSGSRGRRPRLIHRAAAAACAVALILLGAWFLWPRDGSGPDQPKVTVTRLPVRMMEFVFGNDGRLTERRPLAGATVTVLARPDVSKIEPAVTDAGGQGVIKVSHSPGIELKVHFLITDVPPALKPKEPLVTTSAGALKEGEGFRSLREPPETVVADKEVELGVVPYSEAHRYYVLATSSTLARVGTESLERSLEAVTGELGLAKDLQERTLARWAEQLARDRPAVPLDANRLAELPAGVRDLAERLAPTVCYVTTDDQFSAGWSGTGVVVGKDLVLVADFGTNTKFKSVGFGATAAASGDRTYEVTDVAYRSAKHQVALLRTPGVPDPVVRLAEADPAYPGHPSAAAVIGYVASDPRAPDGVRSLLENGGHNRKRVMPAERIALDADRLKLPFATLGHDATTGAGTGGAPVLDISTGLLVGVHIGGVWEGVRKRNGALPIWDLLDNSDARAILEGAGAVVVEPRRVRPAIARALLDSFEGYSADFLPGAPSLPPPKAKGAAAAGAVLKYRHLSVQLDERRGLALWAAANVDRGKSYRIDREEFREPFFFDPRVQPQHQRGFEFYAQNELDRGHLIRPRAVAWGPEREAKEAFLSAYSLANVTPQHAHFNRVTWAGLEAFVSEKFYPDQERMAVFAGPVHADDDPSYRGGRIPQEYWMVAAVANSAEPARPHVRAWIVSHRLDLTADGVLVPIAKAAADPAVWQTTVAAIEQKTGLDFGPLRQWSQ